MKIDDYRLLITLDETKTLRKAAEIYIFLNLQLLNV